MKGKEMRGLYPLAWLYSKKQTALLVLRGELFSKRQTHMCGEYLQ